MEKLLIEPEIKWFAHKFTDEPPSESKQLPLDKINQLKEEAKRLIDQDIVYYNQYRERVKRSDHLWIKTVLNKGTLGDRITANSILIQDSAVHNMSALEGLISSVKLSKKRECMLAIDGLKNIFGNLLLPKRELKTFNQHPLAYLETIEDKRTRDKRLILWYYESLLKSQYTNFIRALQLVFQDNLSTTKFKVSSVLLELIASNQYEQCGVILDIVVNKLGDPDYQVASKIIYYLKNYLTKCPNMKIHVLNEIERLVSRHNINPRAQYYGFCCLNQFVLDKQSDQPIANKLMVVYFSFFKKFVKSKEVDSRMLSALLTGVNRAYRYAKMQNDEIDNNLNTLFKLVHITTFNVSLQALMLLNQVIQSREDLLNRYFNALYRKMLDLEWRNTSKQTFFLNLLYNSLIKDDALPRIKAFVKRLMQISYSQGAPFVCGSFMLISELLREKKNLFLLDGSVLIRNVNKQNGLENGSLDDDDDEEEHFVDAKNEESDREEENKQNDDDDDNDKKPKTGGATSWVHKKNIIHKRHDRYDHTERNPLYCGADKTLTYELLPFTRHYHPTVVVFANKLMNNEPVEYTGDPMEDFTLIHFLDRFVYKNPKKQNSKNEPNKKNKKSVFEPVKSIKKSNIKNIPINSKEYLNLNVNQIPEEEKFFYNYYKSQSEKKNKLENEIDSDAESISDREFDEFLNKTEVDGIDGNDDDFDIDEDVDFTDVINEKKTTSKNKKKKKQEDDDEDDDSLMDSDDLDDDDDLENALNDEDFGEEDIDDDDDTFIDMPKKKKRGKEDLSKLFAAADEFSDLINESSKYDEMGVGSISNYDNADPRQLKWEMDYNDSKPGRGGGGGGGGKKNGKSKFKSAGQRNNAKSKDKKSNIGKFKNSKKINTKSAKKSVNKKNKSKK